MFVYRPAQSLVVKLQYGDDDRPDFQNIAEWSLWSSATKGLRKWLAPCHFISSNGMVLLQERCEPCPEHLIPLRVPKVLDDLHVGNWGIFEGRPVARDYGRNLAYQMTANAKAMVTLR
ncbi:hypothetical protein M2322_002666 [Rhodoblastus acidophilus]|uniref:hypothetical protein n=1 Tax=Rhodoblastus acidophilus TaxID=1074 RepID=UPI002224CF0B|nr:hypothetical protein [Rhodoblastus acidophilus]MCW2317112.1 hypothetical protein [Rhodoblastus acidophilus]